MADDVQGTWNTDGEDSPQTTQKYRRCVDVNNLQRQMLDRTCNRLNKELTQTLKQIENEEVNLQLRLALLDFERTYHKTNRLANRADVRRAKTNFIADWNPFQTVHRDTTSEWSKCDLGIREFADTKTNYRTEWKQIETWTLSPISRQQTRPMYRRSDRTARTITSSESIELTKRSTVSDISTCLSDTPSFAPNDKKLSLNTLTCFPLSSTRRRGLTASQKHHRGEVLIPDTTRHYKGATTSYLSRNVFDRLYNTKASIPRTDVNVSNVKGSTFDRQTVKDLLQCRYLRLYGSDDVGIQ